MAVLEQQFEKQALAPSPAEGRMTPRIGDFGNCGEQEERAQSSSPSGDHSRDITLAWPLAAPKPTPPRVIPDPVVPPAPTQMD